MSLSRAVSLKGVIMNGSVFSINFQIDASYTDERRRHTKISTTNAGVTKKI